MRPPDKHRTWTNTTWGAWRVALKPANVNQTACLAAWLLHCPGAHPFWSYWIVSVVHLREIEGAEPPCKAYPEAAYELHSIALNPDHQPDPDEPQTFRYLDPLDVAEQFHGLTDEQAVYILEQLVDVVIAGNLSPDCDYRSRWKALLWGTIEHLTTGHPEGSA